MRQNGSKPDRTGQTNMGSHPQQNTEQMSAMNERAREEEAAISRKTECKPGGPCGEMGGREGPGRGSPAQDDLEVIGEVSKTTHGGRWVGSGMPVGGSGQKGTQVGVHDFSGTDPHQVARTDI